jgi:glutaredoxin-like protein NrdH
MPNIVTLYSKPACPYCDRAKAWLEKNDITYETINVMEDPRALEFIKSKGHKTVPQIYKGEYLLVEGGYDGLKKSNPEMLRESLAA